MRAFAVLLVAVVLVPAAMVSVSPSADHRPAARSVNIGADPGPNLMPPDPVSGRWPAAGMRATSTAPVHPAAVLGEARVLVLLIQFTNVSHEPNHDAAFFDHS